MLSDWGLDCETRCGGTPDDEFRCECAVCGGVFYSQSPGVVCGRCDYLNGLEELEDCR